MKKLVLIVCCALLVSACQKKEQPAAAVAPAKLTKVNAAAVQNLINDNKGKVLFVNFFATWCPPCRKEVPELVALYKGYAGGNVSFIGVSIDENGEEAVKPFAEKVNFNYPVYVGEADVSKAFQIDAIPNSLLFAKDGKLIQNIKGYIEPEELKKMIDALNK